ncbi:DinB family protein [Bacillus sp. CECT 9360]|uniref:DinB family protein n=1 Tax=Bacillus sp. CECT 9360 TaxID=2845821 RepID=UPI001E2B0B2F|nr:DinB family protein [Bacillus sp. CECT 9360]CAH0344119.1 hypothetical protein BCI9360_00350 [Bacillus sp. CECT 9360]
MKGDLMSNIHLLTNEHKFSYYEEDWYPPLTAALEGLSAKEATWKPAGESVNSIWETINHMLYFEERLLYQLEGRMNQFNKVSENDLTFKEGNSDDDQAWEQIVKKINEIHAGLKQAITSLQEDDFESFAEAIMGVIRHDAYHTGQIIQIRKLQGSWAAKRRFEF